MPHIYVTNHFKGWWHAESIYSDKTLPLDKEINRELIRQYDNGMNLKEMKYDVFPPDKDGRVFYSVLLLFWDGI